MKMLFLKLFDEPETPKCYEFMILNDESVAETAERIRTLFEKSIKSRRYKDVFTTRFSASHPPSLDLDASRICFIVKQFPHTFCRNAHSNLRLWPAHHQRQTNFKATAPHRLGDRGLDFRSSYCLLLHNSIHQLANMARPFGETVRELREAQGLGRARPLRSWKSRRPT